MQHAMPPKDESLFDTPTIPARIAPQNDAEYFAVITRAVFQAGVAWAQIAKRWNAYLEAFDGFNIARIAAYDDAAIERVLATPGVLRMRRKVVATIANARALLAIEREYGSFAAYLASFAEYSALSADLRGRLAFVGEMNVWYVLFRTGHDVPPFEEWITTIPGDHPRMREMVERAHGGGEGGRSGRAGRTK